MAHSVFAIFILLSVFSKAVTVLGVSSTAPPPTLTFDCSDGTITNINVNNNESLLVETGQDGKFLCHYTDENCSWKNKQILRVIYDQDEPSKDSKFVAGKLYRYSLECKVGYLAQVSVAAFNINSLTTKKYELQTETEKTPTDHDVITIRIAKKGEDSKLQGKVYVGDPLVLRITGQASHSLKPVMCRAYSKERTNNKYMLWDNTGCKSSDTAVMSNNWNTINEYTIEIDLLAFRFVDSFSVIIECSAYVCPLSATMCGQSIHNCLTTAAPTKVATGATAASTKVATGATAASTKVATGATAASTKEATGATAASTKVAKGATAAPLGTTKPKRRRRSNIRNDYKEKIASTSFTVVDGGSDSSGCAGLSSNITLFFTTLIVCLFIIGRDSSNHGK